MKTRREQAVASFHNPYSCAQAVAAAFGPADEATLAQMKSLSAGRAPEGRCGALWAAMSLLPEAQRADCEAYFAKEAGDTACRVLKKELHTPCERCVDVASAYLESHLSQPA